MFKYEVLCVNLLFISFHISVGPFHSTSRFKIIISGYLINSCCTWLKQEVTGQKFNQNFTFNTGYYIHVEYISFNLDKTVSQLLPHHSKQQNNVLNRSFFLFMMEQKTTMIISIINRSNCSYNLF